MNCPHHETAARYRRRINGVEVLVFQCLACGKETRTVPRADPVRLVLVSRDLFDEELRQRVYDEYLSTPEWDARRRKVLERDGYLCQACRVNRATQAHHLTYDRVGHEPLFDLIAICTECHAALHNAERLQKVAS